MFRFLLVLSECLEIMSTRRVKVMYVVFSLDTGGLERVVVDLCNRLDTARFAPTICVFCAGGALEACLDTSRVEFLVLKRHWNNDPTLPFRLAWHLRHRRIDILQTQSWGTLIEGVTAATLAGTPATIHCEHGILEEQSRHILFQRWLWPRVNQVTAVAAPLADRMASLVDFPRDRIQVIPNGIDTDRFRPHSESQNEWRRKFGIPQTGLLIGTAARLVPVKNHVGTLQAIARLRAKGVQARFVLAGDGPLRDELQQVVRDLGIAEQVHFLGDVHDVHEFLNTLDVFVLFSHSEGMSITVLEAMACGLPVVASSVGSNPMLVTDGDSGYVVPSGDVESLVNTLAVLAEDPRKRQAMGLAGRKRIENSFSIDRMVQSYSDLYDTLGTKHLRTTAPVVSCRTSESESVNQE